MPYKWIQRDNCQIRFVCDTVCVHSVDVSLAPTQDLNMNFPKIKPSNKLKQLQSVLEALNTSELPSVWIKRWILL